MKTIEEISGYKYSDSTNTPAHAYLLPAVLDELQKYFANISQADQRVFDLGCGNGSVATVLSHQGLAITGIDPSSEGIRQANSAFPELKLSEGSAYDDLHSRFGAFPAVVSLEVVEHVYAPRDYAATLFSLVQPGGIAIVSTPYHGYLKNLALAITGQMDQHFTVLWDHGHIKFWSMQTLTQLLTEAGFANVRYRRVGRIPALAKSMIAIASKSLK